MVTHYYSHGKIYETYFIGHCSCSCVPRPSADFCVSEPISNLICGFRPGHHPIPSAHASTPILLSFVYSFSSNFTVRISARLHLLWWTNYLFGKELPSDPAATANHHLPVPGMSDNAILASREGSAPATISSFAPLLRRVLRKKASVQGQ